jgi:hypothetical protein
MATTETIDKILKLLSEAYPSQNLKTDKEALKETVKLYRAMLFDIDDGLLEAATLQHISAHKWFPAVSELREAALLLVTFHHQAAEEAWGEVRRHFKITGQYRTPEWSSPMIAQAVKIIGWQTLCNSDNEMADRAHFFKVYAALKAREDTEILMLPQVRELTRRLSMDNHLSLSEGDHDP